MQSKIRKIPAVSMATVLAVSFALPGFAQDQDAPTVLGLTQVEIREKPRAEYGRDIIGTLPGGTIVKVEERADGRIEEVEARGDSHFPIAAVEALVPEAVRANAQWPKDALLEKIEFDRDGRIELEGRLSNGRSFDAEFAADGQLLEFDTDD